MPNPANASAELDVMLTNIALGYQPNMYKNRIILPPVPVTKDTGKYYVGKNGLFIYNTERAPRTQPLQIDQKFGSGTYHTREHALDHPLDASEIQAAQESGVSQLTNLEQTAMNYVMNSLELKREKEAMGVVGGTSYYHSNNKLDLSGTHRWSDYTSGTPLEDINEAVKVCKGQGAMANTLVMDDTTFRFLVNHPSLISYFKNQMGQLTEAQVLSLIPGIKKIIITDAVYNSGDEDNPVLVPIKEKFCAVMPVFTPQEMQMGVRLHSAMFDKTNATKTYRYSVGALMHIQQFVQYGVEAINDQCGFLFTETWTV